MRGVLETKRAAEAQLWGSLGVALLVALWSAWGTEFNLPKLAIGLPRLWDLLERMLPPDAGILRRLAAPIIETIQIAILGTAIPVLFTLPLALLGAANTSPYPSVALVTRLAINSLRTIPEVVWALLLVSVVGLGPLAGVLALTLHTTGGLGKLYAEAIETVDPGVVQAIEATGAGRVKVLWYAILPSCIPVMVSQTLWYWEYNCRASTVLGLVGAGGIGLTLTFSMKYFRYTEVLTCLIVIVLILTAIDRFSAALRARII